MHGEDASRTFSLDGGLGGYDYTKGMLPRLTAWRWAYGTGRLDDGTVLGFNIPRGSPAWGSGHARTQCGSTGGRPPWIPVPASSSTVAM